MKSNIINGLMLIVALAVTSCATQKLASGNIEDDVYNTKAKAGDAPDAPPPTYRQDVYTQNTAQAGDKEYYDTYGDNYQDDDYYYYDSYASRINRFNYFSPFNYYDDFYYGYSPYAAYGYAGLGYGGFGLGLGYGGYGYAGYGPGFGYGGYYGYSPFGIGYGGGYPFWGIYSAYGGSYGYGGYGYGGGVGYAANRPRPFRGSGAPGGAMISRSVRGVGYNGNYPATNVYPGRPGNNNYGRKTAINGYPANGNGNTYNNGNSGRPARATRTDYPTYQPQPARTTNSFPGNDGGSRSSGTSNSAPASNNSGGGGRPVRP